MDNPASHPVELQALGRLASDRYAKDSIEKMAAKRKYDSARQRHRQAHILETVRAMLDEMGYDGMTIRALAKRAGVAQGTLYNIYGGKDGLVLAAVDDLMTKLTGGAEREQSTQGVDGIFALSRIVGAQIEATPRYADAMTRILFHVGPNDPLADVLFARTLPFVRTQLEIAQRDGDVRPDIDTNLVARHLVGQQWGVVLLWMMGMIPLSENGKERQRSEIMTLLGIATEAARPRLEARLAELDRP